MTDTIRWEGVVALLDTPTNDGRPGIPSEGFKTRDMPLPLRSILENPSDGVGHMGARWIGNITEVAIVGNELHARGRMDADTFEANYLLKAGPRKWLTPGVDIEPMTNRLMAVTLVVHPSWTPKALDGRPASLFVWLEGPFKTNNQPVFPIEYT